MKDRCCTTCSLLFLAYQGKESSEMVWQSLIFFTTLTTYTVEKYKEMQKCRNDNNELAIANNTALLAVIRDVSEFVVVICQ